MSVTVYSHPFSQKKKTGERDRFLREGTAVHELCVCGNSVARLNILNLTVKPCCFHYKLSECYLLLPRDEPLKGEMTVGLYVNKSLHFVGIM